MIISAAGFLAVLYYVFFRLTPGDVVIDGGLGFEILFPIFVVILAPSALWLPSSKLYVDGPSVFRWVMVRTVLLLVGLASIAMAWVFFALEVGDRDAAYWAATVGACYFAFHTFVLDAIIWAALFRRPRK
jgi:hypothetical protein